MKKTKLWFITLFSLILVLGVYYLTLPDNTLKTIKVKQKVEKNVINEVVEEESLTALRVSLEEERQEKLENLKHELINDEKTSEEKNNIYEELKYLNELQGKEENIEKKIKRENNIDCFVKINNQDISLVCISKEHNIDLANKIMRTVQSNYENKVNISIKFQKK